MRDPRLTRRTFLAGIGAAGATLLGRLPERPARTPSATPRPIPSGSAGASPAPPATPQRRPPVEPSLRAMIGQMLLVGFRGTDADSASAVLTDIRDRGLGGVVLFSVDQPTGSAVRNIVSPEQLATLTTALPGCGGDRCAAAGSAADCDRPGGRPGRAPWSGLASRKPSRPPSSAPKATCARRSAQAATSRGPSARRAST